MNTLLPQISTVLEDPDQDQDPTQSLTENMRSSLLRRSSSFFARSFAATIGPEARLGSILGFGTGTVPTLQVV